MWLIRGYIMVLFVLISSLEYAILRIVGEGTFFLVLIMQLC